jgi:hypothetical protein
MSSEIELNKEIHELMKKCLEQMKRTANLALYNCLSKQAYNMINADPLKSMELFGTAKFMSDLLRQ